MKRSLWWRTVSPRDTIAGTRPRLAFTNTTSPLSTPTQLLVRIRAALLAVSSRPMRAYVMNLNKTASNSNKPGWILNKQAARSIAQWRSESVLNACRPDGHFLNLNKTASNSNKPGWILNKQSSRFCRAVVRSITPLSVFRAINTGPAAKLRPSVVGRFASERQEQHAPCSKPKAEKGLLETQGTIIPRPPNRCHNETVVLAVLSLLLKFGHLTGLFHEWLLVCWMHLAIRSSAWLFLLCVCNSVWDWYLPVDVPFWLVVAVPADGSFSCRSS